MRQDLTYFTIALSMSCGLLQLQCYIKQVLNIIILMFNLSALRVGGRGWGLGLAVITAVPSCTSRSSPPSCIMPLTTSSYTIDHMWYSSRAVKGIALFRKRLFMHFQCTSSAGTRTPPDFTYNVLIRNPEKES